MTFIWRFFRRKLSNRIFSKLSPETPKFGFTVSLLQITIKETNMKKIPLIILLIFIFLSGVSAQALKISPNGRFFAENGQPFFWLGDTAWLLLKKCTREETIQYLDIRQKQGFNVVQVMILHDVKNAKNADGKDAIANSDVSKPIISTENNYWDHLERVIDEAAKRKIYVALVPVWGSNVKAGLVNKSQAKIYAEFLAKRFKDKPNIIWLNGGDLRGDDHPEIWKIIGETLRNNDKNHLIGFHPRGRTMSSEFFHNENWLDFNMFQSGHRNYSQDNSPEETHHFGEDNWRYAQIDYNLNRSNRRSTANLLRKYSAGFARSENAALECGRRAPLRLLERFCGQCRIYLRRKFDHAVLHKGEPNPAYGAEIDWRESINAEGANQMRHLKKLLQLKPYFERVPANDLVIDQGEKYDYIAAARGKNYAFFYVYNGRKFTVKLGFINAVKINSFWFNPRTGTFSGIKTIPNKGVQIFDPPNEEKEGNDWVLVLGN